MKEVRVMVERFNAQVGADIKEFQRKMNEVDRQIRELATGVDVDLDLATKDFYAEVQAAKEELKGLDGKEARMQVDLAYAEFMRDLYQVYALAETLDDYDIDVEVDAIITDFQKKILIAKRLAQGLDGTHVDVDVKLDASHFNRHYIKVLAKISVLRVQDIWVNVKMNYRNFQNTMGHVASQMRNWGEIFGTMFNGSLIAMIPTLSPIVSSLIGLIGSLGVMIGVVGGQMLIMASALGIAAAGFVGLGAVAIPTIKALFDETAKLTAAQQEAKASWDGFIDVYDELVAKTEGAVLDSFTSAMEGATKILSALEPMILGVADAAARLAESFSQSIDSAPIQRIFDAFNTFGPGIFENFTSGIGLFVQGLFSLIAALAPAGLAWTENFNGMMESFAAWSDGLNESEKFKDFISYVQEYMPVINQLFGDLILGIVDFFVAFGDMAGDFMVSLADMMSRFREWAATLGENDQFQRFLNYIREATPQVLDLMKNLWDLIINLGIAMAPFGAIVLDLTNKFLAWLNAKMAAEGMISKLIGVLPLLIGGFLALMAPTVALITIFGKTLVGAINIAINSFGFIGRAITKLSPYFMTIIDDVARLIPFITNLASKALPLLMRGFTLLTGPVGIAIAIIAALIAIGVALYKNWDVVSEKASALWNYVVEVFQYGVDKAKKWVNDMAESVSNKFQQMGEAVGVKMNEMKDWIVKKWDEAVSFLKGINLIQIGKDIIGGLVSGITSKFSDVAKSLSSLTDKIPSWVKSALGIKSPSRVMAAVAKWIPAGIAKGILDNVNLVKTASNKMSDAVTLDFTKEVDKSTSVFKNMMNVVTRTVKETAKKQQGERYEALEKALSDHKKWTDLTLEQEYAYWREAAKYLKDGAGAKNKALQNANNIQKQLLEEQFNNEINFIDAAREYGIMSLAEQIKAYEEYMKQYKVGTEQQVAYEEKLYTAKKALYENLQSIAKNYLSEVESIYQKLADEEQKLRDEWQKTYEARRDTLANTWGLFDEVKLTEMVTYKEDGSIDKQIDLIGNMRQQVATLSNWMNDIFRLQSFGLDEALIKEFQNLGPKAAAEINALANMSSQQLREYEMLWKAKMELAGKQATNELEGARLDMEAEIVKLRENAVKDLEKLKVDMLKEVDEMVNGSTDKFDVLEATLPEIGKRAIQGLIDGIKSQSGQLKSTVQGIANDISREMSGILSGERFNATSSFTPAITSSSTMKVNSNSYSNMELERPQVNVNVNSMWSGNDVKHWIDETDAVDTKLSVKKI